MTTRQSAAVLSDVKKFEEQGIKDYGATLWGEVIQKAGIPVQ